MFWAGNSVTHRGSDSWTSSASPLFKGCRVPQSLPSTLRPQAQSWKSCDGPGKSHQSSPAPGTGGLPAPRTLGIQELRLTQTLLLEWLSSDTWRTYITVTQFSPRAPSGKLLRLVDQNDICMHIWHEPHCVHCEAPSIWKAVCYLYFCQRLAVAWNTIALVVANPQDTCKRVLGS